MLFYSLIIFSFFLMEASRCAHNRNIILNSDGIPKCAQHLVTHLTKIDLKMTNL